MWTRLGVLVWFLALAGAAEAATYYATPAGGAAATCVDRGANVCTIVRAITVAVDGDTIEAACGTYDQGATTLTIIENFTIKPATPGCAIITGTNATYIVQITAANNASILTFGAFDVQYTGGATATTVRVETAAYDAKIVFDGTTISVGGTLRHLSDVWVRGTLELRNVNFYGTIGSQAAFISSTTPNPSKRVLVVGGQSQVTMSAAGTPLIYLDRTAGTTNPYWARVQNIKAVITTATAASTYGVRFNKLTYATDPAGLLLQPPIAENNDITINGPTAAGELVALVTNSSDATTVADGVIIRNNRLACNGPAARCISIGGDGVTPTNSLHNIIQGNTLSNNFYNGVATPHGISCGDTTGCRVLNNRITGFAIGILLSEGVDHLASGNLVIGAHYAPLFAKGNTSATFVNNTVIMDDRIVGPRSGAYGCLGVAEQTGANVATLFQNNSCYVVNGTGWKYAVVDVGDAATFEHNHYYSEVTLAANPWSYQGSTDATVAAWNARATVGTDFSSRPWLKPDGMPKATSPLLNAGQYLSAQCANILTGLFCKSTPDIGAYQIP